MLLAATPARAGFNTQPPEGGWVSGTLWPRRPDGFNTQPPEGGWPTEFISRIIITSFNTQPPEGGWISFGTWLVERLAFQHTAA